MLFLQIDESKNEMQASQGRGKVLDFLMKQKKDGKIPGILGRLGDLGAIDGKFDVAISTCCSRLDNILVDTVETAQMCIEYLKKYDVGRGNFIALEKMATYQQRAHSRISTPENVDRLFDLVRVEDERVLPAFYFALSDTLVVPELEQATRIAYQGKRWRVVTLKGEVIETSGTMSGGGKQMMRGKMGQQVATKTKGQTPKSNKELERTMVEAERMQSRINELQVEQGELEKELMQLQGSIKQKDYETQKLEREIRTLTDQLPKIFETLQKQEEKVRNTHSDEREVQALEEQIAGLRKTSEASSKAADKIQSRVDGFQSQIQDIHNKKIKTFKTKITDLSKQIDKLTSNMSKLKVEIAASERNVKKCENNIENTAQEITAAEEKLRKMNETRENAVARQTELEEALKEIVAEISKAEDGFGDIKKEIAALLKQEHQGKVKRQELEQVVQGIEAELSELKKKMPAWERRMKELSLHDLPNQEAQVPFKIYTEEELEGHKVADIQYEITTLDEQLQNKPNLSAIEEFRKKREVYLERVKVLEDITTKRNEMRQTYDEVRKHRFTEFMQGFNIINRKLKEMYQMITLGGDAELELVDSMDPFNEGIVFSVRPPKKSWKQISNLSGGEKTLSSLALVFGLHYYKPSPLYVMDEIDAALDFKNVSIVANYIKERTKNAQFIIISLRSNMFELSDHLVGISKYEDCTKAVTMKNFQPATVRGTSSQVPNLTMSSQAFDSLKSPPTNVAAAETPPFDDSSQNSTVVESASFVPDSQATEGASTQSASYVLETQSQAQAADESGTQELESASYVLETQSQFLPVANSSIPGEEAMEVDENEASQ